MLHRLDCGFDASVAGYDDDRQVAVFAFQTHQQIEATHRSLEAQVQNGYIDLSAFEDRLGVHCVFCAFDRVTFPLEKAREPMPNAFFIIHNQNSRRFHHRSRPGPCDRQADSYHRAPALFALHFDPPLEFRYKSVHHRKAQAAVSFFVLG